jgi:Holliday junction resolvasome RuvABC endonuclease subunit
MVQLIAKLGFKPKIDDASDALAVAICHAQHYPIETLAA